MYKPNITVCMDNETVLSKKCLLADSVGFATNYDSVKRKPGLGFLL